MSKEPSKKTFGVFLRYYRNRTCCENGKALSQENMANEMNHYPNVLVSRDHVYKWENEKSILGPKDRPLIQVIIKVLVEFGGITSVSEANQLINSGGLKNLENYEISEIPFPHQIENNFGQTHHNTDKPSTEHKVTPLPGGNRNHSDDPFHLITGDIFCSRPPQNAEIEGYSALKPTSRLLREAAMPYSTRAISPYPHLQPAVPEFFVGRQQDLFELKHRLLNKSEENEPNILVLTGNHAWSGVGKSTLASAIALDAEVTSQYPDGILWMTLGDKPNIKTNLQKWGLTLGLDKSSKTDSIQDTFKLLATYLQDKRMLVVVDDVWNFEDLQPFLVGGRDCAHLITTRFLKIAKRIVTSSDQIFSLDGLSEEDSFNLLKQLAHHGMLNPSQEMVQLINMVERHPLVLQIIGRLIQTKQKRNFSVNELIAEINEKKMHLGEKVTQWEDSLAGVTTPSIAALLVSIIDHLDSQTRDCYIKLCSLSPSPAIFDFRFIGAIWQTSDPEPMIKVLCDRGLVDYTTQPHIYKIHSLLVLLIKHS
ncbi:MAG: NB-ARC domain-containing protein [Anaerolineaceae bacterium]